MRASRLIGLIGLFALLGLAVGCGSDPKPAPGGAPAVAPAPAPNPQPVGNPTDPKGAAQPDAYELDPAKHVIPATAVTGRLAGKTFTPDRVELEGDRLTFRQGKDFFPDLSIEIFFAHANYAPGTGRLAHRT